MTLYMPNQIHQYGLLGGQRVFGIHPHIAEKRGTEVVSGTFGHTVEEPP